mgnify:FL=1
MSAENQAPVPQGYDYFEKVKPASHSLKKREMWTQLAELDTNEDFWPALLERFSDGEFLSSVAEILEINHAILRNWIRGNKEKETAYKVAEADGKRRRMDKVMEKVHTIATTDSQEPPTRMEQLRAAEILLKQKDSDPVVKQQFGDITINFVSAKDGKPAIEGEVLDQLP